MEIVIERPDPNNRDFYKAELDRIRDREAVEYPSVWSRRKGGGVLTLTYRIGPPSLELQGWEEAMCLIHLGRWQEAIFTLEEFIATTQPDFFNTKRIDAAYSLMESLSRHYAKPGNDRKELYREFSRGVFLRESGSVRGLFIQNQHSFADSEARFRRVSRALGIRPKLQPEVLQINPGEKGLVQTAV